MPCLAVIDQCEVGANISFTCDNSPRGNNVHLEGHYSLVYTVLYRVDKFHQGRHYSLVNNVLGRHY